MKAPKSIWVKGSKKLYLDACSTLDYPNIPMGKYFDKYIKPTDTVLDIGCGFGVASLLLSKKCKHVTAFDLAGDAIEHLNNEIASQNIKNISTTTGVFPDVNVEPCDVTIVLYVFHLLKDAQCAKSLLNLTKREGLMLCASPQSDDSFKDGMLKELGFEGKKSPCKNGCYEKAMLESLGAKVECQKLVHDFGQPVENLEEAIKFFMWQLHLDDEYYDKVKEIAPKYITTRNEKPYINIKRNSCLLHFIK